MNKKRALTLLVVFLLTSRMSAFGPAVQVSGEVFYQNKPAVNYTVSVGGKFAFVDVKGRFRILDVPTGAQTLQVFQDRRKIRELSVTVRAPGTTIPRINL